MSSLTMFVLGCGTMGIAVTSGVLQSLHSPLAHEPSASGANTPIAEGEESSPQLERFIATVGRPESVKRLRRVFNDLPYDLGSKVDVWPGSDNAKAAKEADIILICCKPQLVASLLAEIPQEHFENKLVISICAGLKIDQIKALVPESAVVARVMPNTPAKIREGMTMITPIPSSATLARIPSPTRQLQSIFSSIGLCRVLEEKHFDACTALSGSGPAFASLVLEAMADGGVMMGLPRKEATELAAQTMQGAARMVLTGLHPAQLKDSVTTPGGCTIAGLLTLEDGKVRSTMARAIQVAAQHASGLGQAPKK